MTVMRRDAGNGRIAEFLFPLSERLTDETTTLTVPLFWFQFLFIGFSQLGHDFRHCFSSLYLTYYEPDTRSVSLDRKLKLVFDKLVISL